MSNGQMSEYDQFTCGVKHRRLPIWATCVKIRKLRNYYGNYC